VVEIPGHTFNLERGGEKQIPGDRTAAKILACDKKAKGITSRWNDMDGRQKEELVLALVEFANTDALARHLQNRLGFTPEQADALSKVRPEESRCALSRRALEELEPYLRDGMSFATAKEQIPEYRAKTVRQSHALDFLPRVLGTDEKHLPSRDGRFPCFKRARDLRNPAVTRALAELRKVVNAIIRRYGKPLRIHVELGRELKKTPKAREAIAKANRERQTEKEKARSDIEDSAIKWNPDNDDDVKKWLLGQEQGWHCPYCCQSMSPGAPDLQIDHIIPRSISHDNNMPNLVLCHADCNLEKGKRAPCDAFDAGKLAATQRFAARFPPGKRQRFLWTHEDIERHYADETGGFTRRQLQDTQYASRLAGEFLGLLYGGVIDAYGNRRVQLSSGGVTAILRQEWGLNAVIPGLPDSPAHRAAAEIRLDEKLRTDHRHHAVDAVVIACTTPTTIKLLSDAAGRVELAELKREDIRDSTGRRRTRYAEINPPWETQDSFVEAVRAAIADIRVSRRPERKVQGPLHAETNYSRELNHQGTQIRRQRIELTKLTEKDIEGDVIADPIVRETVRAKWRELRDKWVANKGGDSRSKCMPKQVFASAEDHPRMPARPERQSPPIHTVRINVGITPITVGHGTRQRFVVSGKNTVHHTMIVAEKTPRGERWRDEPVDRLEVHRRKRDGRSLVQKELGADELVMCLCKNDCIEMDDKTGERIVYVVKAISKRDIKVRLNHDARTDEQITGAGQRKQFRITSADTLRDRNACRVVVDPLGDVQRVSRGRV